MVKLNYVVYSIILFFLSSLVYAYFPYNAGPQRNFNRPNQVRQWNQGQVRQWQQRQWNQNRQWNRWRPYNNWYRRNPTVIQYGGYPYYNYAIPYYYSVPYYNNSYVYTTTPVYNTQEVSVTTAPTTTVETTPSYTTNVEPADPVTGNHDWANASNGAIPMGAIIYQSDQNRNYYYCRSYFKGSVYYGILIANEGCIIEDKENAATMRFMNYQVAIQIQ